MKSEKSRSVEFRKEFGPKIEKIERRLFLKRGLTLGAMSMLSGCTLKDNDTIDRVLWAMSRWNDRVQEKLFNPNKLAKIYTEAEITNPFPFNAYYEEPLAPVIDANFYSLELSGLIENKQSWTLPQLRELPKTQQITQHICVEGWSAIGKWGGVPFKFFLEKIGADLTAKYVGFKCGDNYSTSIDMPTAIHPQTLLVLDFPGKPGETKYGFPVKVRIPTKLGFKNPKFVTEIFVSNSNPGGYWEDKGYNWYSGS